MTANEYNKIINKIDEVIDDYKHKYKNTDNDYTKGIIRGLQFSKTIINQIDNDTDN